MPDRSLTWVAFVEVHERHGTNIPRDLHSPPADHWDSISPLACRLRWWRSTGTSESDLGSSSGLMALPRLLWPWLSLECCLVGGQHGMSGQGPSRMACLPEDTPCFGTLVSVTNFLINPAFPGQVWMDQGGIGGGNEPLGVV